MSLITKMGKSYVHHYCKSQTEFYTAQIIDFSLNLEAKVQTSV